MADDEESLEAEAHDDDTGNDSDATCADQVDVATLSQLGDDDDAHLASGAYRRLITWIREFEDQLDDDTEIGVRLVTFGRALSFHLCDLSYWNPHFIRFVGADPAGNPVQLIQHINQISVLLMKAPKQNETPRRIGFDATTGAAAAATG